MPKYAATRASLVSCQTDCQASYGAIQPAGMLLRLFIVMDVMARRLRRDFLCRFGGDFLDLSLRSAIPEQPRDVRSGKMPDRVGKRLCNRDVAKVDFRN